jgi:hypothetical protein
MSFANTHFIERAQVVTGSAIISLMFLGWAAATVLLGA